MLGTDYGGKLAIHPPKKQQSSALPSTISPDNQVYLQAFRNAAHRVHIPGMYPTVTQSASSFVPVHAGDADPDVRDPKRGPRVQLALRDVPDAEHRRARGWGIEETGFADAPILANPTTTRTLDGRVYRFYFNGPHLHSSRSRTGSASTGSQNTLLDDLSNADMIAIAQLAPAGRMSAARGNGGAVGVIGVGYVGLVTAACFADLGHDVVCCDVNPDRIEALRAGRVPIYEPGVEPLLAAKPGPPDVHDRARRRAGRCRVVFVCVDTPPTASGDADLSRVRRRRGGDSARPACGTCS